MRRNASGEMASGRGSGTGSRRGTSTSVRGSPRKRAAPVAGTELLKFEVKGGSVRSGRSGPPGACLSPLGRASTDIRSGWSRISRCLWAWDRRAAARSRPAAAGAALPAHTPGRTGYESVSRCGVTRPMDRALRGLSFHGIPQGGSCPTLPGPQPADGDCPGEELPDLFRGGPPCGEGVRPRWCCAPAGRRRDNPPGQSCEPSGGCRRA